MRLDVSPHSRSSKGLGAGKGADGQPSFEPQGGREVTERHVAVNRRPAPAEPRVRGTDDVPPYSRRSRWPSSRLYGCFRRRMTPLVLSLKYTNDASTATPATVAADPVE